MNIPLDIKPLKTAADDELNNPQWGLTRQFLEVNAVQKTNGEYIYERYKIGYETFTGHSLKGPPVIENHHEIVFYYKIENGEYFYGVGVDINTKEITRVFMGNACYCYLSARSENMTLQEMAKLTKLKYFDGGTKGDTTKNGRGFYSASWIDYQFVYEMSYETEEALNMLLDELEKDTEGIKELINRTDACIMLVKYQYVSANAGIEFSGEAIKRLEKLQVDLTIDMYIQGERLKS